jgi:RNA polymerase sigma-70 factor (ECF subfamily)
MADGGQASFDAAWIARVRAGDRPAFEAIFRAYYAALCDYATSYVHAPDVAEEIVQTVFLNVWADRARWVPREGARAYLFGAVRNGALNHRRHARVEDRLLEPGAIDAGVLRAEPPLADAELEAREDAGRVRAAVARLPERGRLAVELRWTHGLRHAEIAEVMGISVKGVEHQLARSLAALRRMLGG